MVATPKESSWRCSTIQSGDRVVHALPLSRLKARLLIFTHVLSIHDVAALADAGDGLMGVHQERLQGGRYGPGLAESPASVRRDVKLHTVGDAYLPRVS